MADELEKKGGKFPLPLFIIFVLTGVMIDLLLGWWIPGLWIVVNLIFLGIFYFMGVKGMGFARTLLPISIFVSIAYVLDAFGDKLPGPAASAIGGSMKGGVAQALNQAGGGGANGRRQRTRERPEQEDDRQSVNEQEVV